MLRVLAWLYCILGGLGLAGGGMLVAWLAADPSSGDATAIVTWLFLIVAVPLLLPAFLGGLGVLLGQSWGRVFFAIASLILLFAIPIGTAIGVVALIALTRERREAGEASGLPPLPSLSGPVGIVLAMLAVGSGFVVAIQAGFFWHGESAPLEISRIFPAAAVIIALATVWLLYALFTGTAAAATRGRVRRRNISQAQREYEAFKTGQAALLQRLDADFDLVTYADRIRAGESWNEDQIAYDRDRKATTCCEHLRDVEAAIRGEGVPVKLQLPGIVHANCTVDEPVLRARFTLDPPAWYGNLPHWDRSAEDPPAAAFKCSEHRSTIFVVEASQARPGTRVFPAR
ncbi:hypothetical protein [Sphingomonas sp.]|uniref:hypothetical protein n=1 Tax=Sphingomonas sp. TaxID=28214 RepID=UPI001B2A8435|nr:hypothetical protein [Sphingomonas sp.]MBO9712538.1 hypothetical protein [Sphingomonas sp.]